MKKFKLPKISFNPLKWNVKKELETGVFFGSGKSIKFDQKKIETLIELFVTKFTQYRDKMNIPLERDQVERDQMNTPQAPNTGSSQTMKDKIYDFFKEMEVGGFSGVRDNFTAGNIRVVGTTADGTFHRNADGRNAEDSGDTEPNPREAQPEPEPTEKPVVKIVKPIDVYKELEHIPDPVKLDDLERQIRIIDMKTELADQLYTQLNLKAAMACLENRRKYNQFREFYEKFPYTNTEKIMNLVEKYGLVMKQSDIFIPEFPAEAIEIMSAYQKTTQELCGKKPVFYVIATKDAFQEKYKKRDPILLVQSPFGFFWNVLGAWDAEMVLLSEL